MFNPFNQQQQQNNGAPYLDNSIMPMPYYDNTSPQVYGSMMAQNNKEAVLSALKEITNEESTIKDVKFILSGIKEVNLNNQIHKVKMHEPLLNDYGVSQVIAYMYGYLSKNVTLSCLTPQYINTKHRQFWTNIGCELGANWVSYGIKNKSAHAQIRGILTQHIYSQLTRALNGFTLIKAVENTNVNENRNMDNNSNRPGLLGFGGLFGGGRR